MKIIINGMLYEKILIRKIYDFYFYANMCSRSNIILFQVIFLLIFIINLKNPQHRSIIFLKIYCLDLSEKC